MDDATKKTLLKRFKEILMEIGSEDEPELDVLVAQLVAAVPVKQPGGKRALPIKRTKLIPPGAV